ncbi:protein FAR1-RELATED SEQUENCE 5-like [Juglans microcarpa x Juglans regia]|uniref:protein FAR1-RELATED SEQUENCE 5-like n=1 Tax=Juglans microcarpa x Juglans regia TaxID=2249226 RepID=UPI001B7EC56D|nr:protein FAR1-RELATED SEQUENCE 5-like [Juglans microcarpa x Juglans regia]
MDADIEHSDRECDEVGIDNDIECDETIEQPTYGKQKGFGVCKRNSRQDDDGNIRWICLACVRGGTSKSKAANVMKPRQIEKIGCMARINAILNNEDARSRAAYESFGDVITFDTTYLTNMYKMPFAQFVGVNRHGQSILFGYGLISNEDANTFEWLFESWLKCMNYQPPKAIITDQDKAMKIAISRVFPMSRLRLCLWHIMKKFPENFGSHSRYEEIKSTLHKCIYDSFSEPEFESHWRDMLDTYDLHVNAWLVSLYSDRRFWYDSAFKRKVENEAITDFSSFNTEIPCISRYPLEKQFQKAYTIAKFKEVQEELRGFLYLTTSLVGCEGGRNTFIVADEVQVGDDLLKRATFTVKVDEDPLDVK